MLWAIEGREAELTEYEDDVLRLLDDHAGTLLERARTAGGSDAANEPVEVQFIRFASEADLAAYMTDDRRAAMADRRLEVVGRTDVWRVTLD